MRERAYALDKPIRPVCESTAAEVRRIWTRWTNGGVSACRYCGAPIILHNATECKRTQAEVEEELECLSS